jgi:hypothetical protein
MASGGSWAVGRKGTNCPRDIRRTRVAIAGPRKIAAGGGFHRRLLPGGEKAGLAVGPTQRGKRTKIIALAEDHSPAFAVTIESSSPHESQLVEVVLRHCFLDCLPL